MKITVIALTAALASSGCFVVHKDDVEAGERLDAKIALSWETRDSQNNKRINCYGVGADTVRVVAKNLSTGTAYTDLFDCNRGEGTSYELTAGNYEIKVDLVNCGQDSACSSPAIVSSAPALGVYGVWNDEIYDLGHFIFLVD